MDEKIEYRGKWWLPEKPEVKLVGSLSVTPGRRAELELQGNLSDSRFWETKEVAKIPVILGLSNNGKQITLHDSLPIKATTLYVHHAFVGVHFNSVEEIRFKSVSIYYAHLDDWVDTCSFGIKYDGDKDEIVITAASPEPIIARVGEYEVALRVDRTIHEDRVRQVAVKYEARIELSSQQERPLKDYLGQVQLIQHFLTLAMSEPTYPLTVKGESQASKQTLGKGVQVYKPIDIYYGVPQLPADVGTVRSFEMLFTLHEIRDRLENALNNWIAKADLLKPVYDLYFSTLYNQDLYLEGTFLNLSQCIEAYHRRRYGGKYQADEEYRSGLYQRFIEVIPQGLDNGFQQSLRDGKLWFANEFSLRKRLQDITERLSDLPISFLDTREARTGFIDKVCNTRHYLTHLDPQLYAKAARDVELFELKEKVKFLLEVCLLEELGFSLVEIGRMIENNQGIKRFFSFIKRKNAT